MIKRISEKEHKPNISHSCEQCEIGLFVHNFVNVSGNNAWIHCCLKKTSVFRWAVSMTQYRRRLLDCWMRATECHFRFFSLQNQNPDPNNTSKTAKPCAKTLCSYTTLAHADLFSPLFKIQVAGETCGRCTSDSVAVALLTSLTCSYLITLSHLGHSLDCICSVCLSMLTDTTVTTRDTLHWCHHYRVRGVLTSQLCATMLTQPTWVVTSFTSVIGG